MKHTFDWHNRSYWDHKFVNLWTCYDHGVSFVVSETLKQFEAPLLDSLKTSCSVVALVFISDPWAPLLVCTGLLQVWRPLTPEKHSGAIRQSFPIFCIKWVHRSRCRLGIFRAAVQDDTADWNSDLKKIVVIQVVSLLRWARWRVDSWDEK